MKLRFLSKLENWRNDVNSFIFSWPAFQSTGGKSWEGKRTAWLKSRQRVHDFVFVGFVNDDAVGIESESDEKTTSDVVGRDACIEKSGRVCYRSSNSVSTIPIRFYKIHFLCVPTKLDVIEICYWIWDRIDKFMGYDYEKERERETCSNFFLFFFIAGWSKENWSLCVIQMRNNIVPNKNGFILDYF